MRHSIAVVALALLLLMSIPGGARSASQTGDRPSFTIGVLRRDGVLVPFATHHRGRWTRAWPTPGRAFVVPITLEDVPKDWWGNSPPTSTWTLWPHEGSPRPVRATAPTRYPAQCLPGFGFRTDYKAEAPVPPPFERPYPKEGLATSGRVRIDKVEILDERAPEWEDFRRRLSEPFHEAERKAIGLFSSWRHPASSQERYKTPVTIERLYRAPLRESGEMYYVEASRAYDDPRQKDGCDVVTFASGWVRPWKPDDKVFDLSAVVTYCDRADVSYVFPLGLIRLDKRPPVWILQVAGWDYEEYLVIETGRDTNRILVSAFGGNCPRNPGNDH